MWSSHRLLLEFSIQNHEETLKRKTESGNGRPNYIIFGKYHAFFEMGRRQIKLLGRNEEMGCADLERTNANFFGDKTQEHTKTHCLNRRN